MSGPDAKAVATAEPSGASGFVKRVSSAIARGALSNGAVLRSALYGALGCAAGALLAQVFYALTPVAKGEERSVVLVVDTSGSMSGSKIDAVKQSARRFARDLLAAAKEKNAVARVAVVAFSDGARVIQEPTDDAEAVDRAVERLSAIGGTYISPGLTEAERVLGPPDPGRRRFLLAFTDGELGDRDASASIARRLREDEVRIVAVKTDDVPDGALDQLTGDPSLVISTSVDRMPEAFRDAADKVGMKGFDTTERYEPAARLLLTAALGALTGAGLALGLTLAQGLALRGGEETRAALLGTSAGRGAIIGLLAALAGQGIALAAGQVPALELLGKVTGWALMGLLLGWGMTRVITNLTRSRGMLGGGLGGLVGGVAFVAAAAVLADAPGRIAGAAALGFAVGMMIVLVDLLVREAWLVVNWGQYESGTINLGATPILLGSGPKAHIKLDPYKGYPPEYAEIRLQDGRVKLVERAGGREHALQNGNKLPLGNITIEVRTA